MARELDNRTEQGLGLGTTAAVARWVAEASIDRLAEDVLAAAKAAMLDTVGAILAGSQEPVTRIVAKIVAEDGAKPVAAQLGVDLWTSPESAALVNGTSGHALDYDDVSLSLLGHPSVVILPAALALAQATGASGGALLEAYVVGVEVMAKLGQAMGAAHYKAGWHATSTLGTLGSAMAAGKLLALDAGRLEHALAIAVSEAGGSRQNFGTMTKPFHAGHAARCGILAARLAQNGMTGNVRALEGPLGFFALFSYGKARLDGIAAALGNPFDLVSPGISVKKYPCCYATHRVADGVLDLVNAYGLAPEEVAEVAVTVPAGGLMPLIDGRPQTGLEGKFSMAYVVSAAILDRRLTLEAFTDARVRRPAVQDLQRLVRVAEDPAIPIDFNAIEEGYVEVCIHLKNGSRLARQIERPRGSPQAPLRHEELVSKFRDCARGVLNEEQIDRAIALLESLEDVQDVNHLVELLVPSGP